MLRIYVAAPWPQREQAEKLAKLIQLDDVPSKRRVIVSRWHRLELVQSLQESWLNNMLDLENAHLLIALTFEEGGREMFVETGLHLAQHKPVFWHHHGKPIEVLSLMHNPDVQQESAWSGILTKVSMMAEYERSQFRPFVSP